MDRPTKKIQLIPNLVSLETNVSQINCFSFWDDREQKNFFKYNPNSKFHFKYLVNNKINLNSGKPTFQFSNLSYYPNKWSFTNDKGPLNFACNIDEKNNTMLVNQAYHNLFIKLGWMQPAGYVLTDYITYKLDKQKKHYQEGAAVQINNKTCLLYGFGRNFKTTLVNLILQNGGYYIGEEFFLLENKKVYSTIPNSHRFDFRDSHKGLKEQNLKNKKVDVSEYSTVVFLIYSNKDKIVEIDINKANQHANLFKHAFNTHFLAHFQAKDFLLGKANNQQPNVLNNKQARYFVAYFTNVNTVCKFIKNL